MPSRLFSTTIYQQIESQVQDLLNSHDDFLSANTARSTRAVGDAIQDILGANFEHLLGDLAADYSAAFARRAMADLAFTDVDGFYYVVDVKTHRTDTSFNMPNLISVERLVRFYEDDSNYFCVLLISYSIEQTRVIVSNVMFVPIEFLDWTCLTIGALGWGQIQIANSNRIILNSAQSRKQWMLQLCDIMLAFYPKEIAKIETRIDHFEQVKRYWLAKPSD